MHPLAAVEAKVRRADVHMSTLVAEIEGYLALNPSSVVLEPQPENDEVIVRAHGVPEPPLSWSVILGDLLHNLRSSLDHLVWQIVAACGGTPDRRTCFPIFGDPAEFDSIVRRPREKGRPSALLGVDQATFDAVELLQPYHEPPGRVSGLAILAELSNIDKHRLVHASLLVMSSQSPTFAGTGFTAVEVKWGPATVKQGAELARLRFFGPPGEEIQATGKLVIEVRFGDMQLPISRLTDLRNAVVVVINHFGQGFRISDQPDGP